MRFDRPRGFNLPPGACRDCEPGYDEALAEEEWERERQGPVTRVAAATARVAESWAMIAAETAKIKAPWAEAAATMATMWAAAATRWALWEAEDEGYGSTIESYDERCDQEASSCSQPD